MAADLDIGFTRSESRPSRVRNCFILAFPQSTTYRTPETVTDVSAMLVARMTFRVLGGAGRKTRCCTACGRAANRGRTNIFGMALSIPVAYSLTEHSSDSTVP